MLGDALVELKKVLNFKADVAVALFSYFCVLVCLNADCSNCEVKDGCGLINS